MVTIPFHGSSVQEEVDVLLSRGMSLGVSNLRFMPKPSSLSAITNLSSVAKLNGTQFAAVNQMGRREAKPVNTQLFHLFSVLKFEKVSAAICLICQLLCDNAQTVSERGQHFLYGLQRHTLSIEDLLTEAAFTGLAKVRMSLLELASSCIHRGLLGYSTRFWCVFVHLSSLSLFYQPPHFVRGQLVHTQITGGYHFRALITALY